METELPILSEYMKKYLQSISYELSDYEIAILISNSTKKFNKRTELLKLAEATSDIRLVEKIYAMYEIKDYALKLFEENDGQYIYTLYEEREEVLGVFRNLSDAIRFQKKEYPYLNTFYIERRKILCADERIEYQEVVLMYQRECDCEFTLYDSEMLAMLGSVAKEKSILLTEQRLNIPIPFQRGDIILFEYYDVKKLGVVETVDKESGEYTALWGEDDGRLNNNLFNPYTATKVESYYDSGKWNMLSDISSVLKGNYEKSLSMIFSNVCIV